MLKIIQKFIYVFMSFFFVSCAPSTIEMRLSRPPEILPEKIKKIAIATFEVVELNYGAISERNGDWKVNQVVLNEKTKASVSNLVRAKVVNLLSNSQYDISYSDEFAKLDNDEAIRNAISAEGFKEEKIDAIINGKIWINIDNYDGVDLAKQTLKFIESGVEGGPGFAVDSLIFWPYKGIKGSLILEVKLTRIDPTEIIAVAVDRRTFGYKIGGAPPNLIEKIKNAVSEGKEFLAEKKDVVEVEQSDLVIPTFEDTVSMMAESVSAVFARKISVTEKMVDVSIAPGGDPQGEKLLKAGAYLTAINRYNKVADNNNPNDKYNLALCYEGIGDFGLANTLYNEALDADLNNLIYAEGVGRIERLKREYRLISNLQ